MYNGTLLFNSDKCSLGFKYIPYLRYIITWEGIKPYPSKFRSILDIG